MCWCQLCDMNESWPLTRQPELERSASSKLPWITLLAEFGWLDPSPNRRNYPADFPDSIPSKVGNSTDCSSRVIRWTCGRNSHLLRNWRRRSRLVRRNWQDLASIRDSHERVTWVVPVAINTGLKVCSNARARVSEWRTVRERTQFGTKGDHKLTIFTCAGTNYLL